LAVLCDRVGDAGGAERYWETILPALAASGVRVRLFAREVAGGSGFGVAAQAIAWGDETAAPSPDAARDVAEALRTCRPEAIVTASVFDTGMLDAVRAASPRSAALRWDARAARRPSPADAWADRGRRRSAKLPRAKPYATASRAPTASSSRANTCVRRAPRTGSIGPRWRSRRRLIVAGATAADDDRSRAAAERYGIDIDWRGHLGADELRAVIDCASAVAVPSLWPEPFGLIGIEAQARGRPAVAYGVGGISEWIGDAGIAVPRGDEAALASAIRTLLDEAAWPRYGYCGWATSLRLSRAGYDVTILEGLARRDWDREHGLASLIPISSTRRRIDEWSRLRGRTIGFEHVDATDYPNLSRVVQETDPGAILHFGQQRSAPFSMIDRDHALRTHLNNTVGNLNVLWALHEHAPDAHLVKLGTMGEYGTPNIDVEEGFISSTTGATIGSRFRNSRDRSTISPKSATAISSISRAARGGCARRISTRASCTEPAPKRLPPRRRSRTGSTTTTSSGPC
jgi:hypothetical protein